MCVCVCFQKRVVILRLSDPKSNVKSAANDVLNNIATEFSVETLLPVTLRLCDHGNPKIQLGNLELIMHLIRRSSAFFSQSGRL